MSDAAAISAAEELDRLEHDLAVGVERVKDLRKRARVIEVETGYWIRPSPRGGFRVSYLVAGITGFWLGHGVIFILRWVIQSGVGR